METEKIDDKLTYAVIGCAMKVHSYLGCGFQEVIYQRALAIEFRKADIPFVREVEMEILYYGEDIGTRRVDFFVENILPVELKAISVLDETHLAQGLNYLEAFRIDKGLLINFGGQRLEVKRLRPTKKRIS